MWQLHTGSLAVDVEIRGVGRGSEADTAALAFMMV